jgi:3',5'-cyclic-AMP phosphodiesterase
VPFTVAQLTDPHIGAPWSSTAPASLAAAVSAIGEVQGRAPDAAIVTGDIASTPTDDEYAEARAILDGLGAPLYPVPGNHDDPARLLRHFDTPSQATSYAVELGPVRLVALDSTRPDGDGGRLDRTRLEWLETTLAADEATPTLLATHHPPIVTGIPTMDAIGIAEPERRALEAVLARHPQVQLIACGHVHRAIAGRLGPATVLAIPSTDMQLALDLAPGELRFVREPPCFAVHIIADGRIVSHVQPIPGAPDDD